MNIQDNMTIKKIILSLIALTAMMSANAQVIDVYINDKLDTTYMNCTSRRNKVVFKSNDTENAADASYEQVDIYENGTLIKTYKNTADNVCKVVFRERDYVEIGGVKWATMNVGATTVSDSKATAYGDYYAWGEIETYYDSLTDTGINFGTKTKTHIPGKKTGHDNTNYYGSTTATEWDSKPYDSNGTLTSEHDAATYEWGGNWRMPTRAEFVKLRTACCGKASDSYYAHTVNNGTITEGGVYFISAGDTVDNVTYKVTGALCVDRSNIQKRIFIPMTASLWGQTRSTSESLFIWSSTYFSLTGANIFGVSPKNNQQVITDYSQQAQATRAYGYPIRPVYVGY